MYIAAIFLLPMLRSSNRLPKPCCRKKIPCFFFPVPGLQAARGEELAGGGKVGDDALAGGREEALGEVEGARRLAHHQHRHRLHRRDGVDERPVRARGIKEVAPQEEKPRA